MPHGTRGDEDRPQPRGVREEGGIEYGRTPAREQDIHLPQHIGIRVELLPREGRALQVYETFDFGQDLRG